MAHIGSVFLGDIQRHRVFSASSSTPPSSPPPPISPSSARAFPISHIESTPSIMQLDAPYDKPQAHLSPPDVTPEVAFELRTRLLESLVVGAQQDPKSFLQQRRKGHALIRETEDLQKKFEAVVQASGSDVLKWFVDHYDQHKQYLTPAFALSGTLPIQQPLYENMSPSELEAYLTEMDADIRAADRDLREIDMLEKKDVTAAGRLPEYQPLQPRLDALAEAHEDNRRKRVELEQRIAKVMNQYANNTDTLSELFVAWDETIYDAESQVGKLERGREERKRLGYAS